MNRTVLIAVGGSGGHLLPAQQLGALLAPEMKILFAGGQLSRSPFFQKAAFPFQDVAALPLRPLPAFLLRASWGILQSLRLLKAYCPDVVVGFGSYHAFPILAAAVLLRKKIILYEANAVLGKVNRLFAPFADLLALQLPLIRPLSCAHQYVSYFPWISPPTSFSREEALQSYQLDGRFPVCLVFGGSQGAAFFNETAPSLLAGCQVIHFAGKEEAVPGVAAAYRANGISAFVQAFEPHMAKAYAAADFVLCRSGAATVAELIRYQKPAVLVPFPHAADDHQSANARFFCEEAKGGLWLAQERSKKLQGAIAQCLSNLAAFSQALQKFYQKTNNKVELVDLVKRI